MQQEIRRKKKTTSESPLSLIRITTTNVATAREIRNKEGKKKDALVRFTHTHTHTHTQTHTHTTHTETHRTCITQSIAAAPRKGE